MVNKRFTIINTLIFVEDSLIIVYGDAFFLSGMSAFMEWKLS